MRVGVFSGELAKEPVDQLLQRVLAVPPMAGSDHVGAVTTGSAYTIPSDGPVRFRVAAVDLGIKSASPQHFARRGVEVTVLPATVSAEQLLDVGVDGVFFSNGPGDPATADGAVALARAVLAARRAFFGICFGHQVLGRALGFGTYKLRYGHRGMNVPVMDRGTGKVEITAQNHGFAVDAPLDVSSDTDFGRVEVSHVCLDDDVVEGLRCLDVPAFSVQYHPEAAAGPHDAGYLFDRFCDLMEAARATA
jgi:carbamoyl-phosphate synthase small subunit